MYVEGRAVARKMWAVVVLLCGGSLMAQAPAAVAAGVGAQVTATATQGGTIEGRVVAGVVGKGGVPLPGVAITAMNSLTGRKYATYDGY